MRYSNIHRNVAAGVGGGGGTYGSALDKPICDFSMHFQTGFGLLLETHNAQDRGTSSKFILLPMPVKHLSALESQCVALGGTWEPSVPSFCYNP
jgi:hypothetical protein